MKKITALATLILGLAGTSLAAEFKGFVEDTMCAGKPEMKNDAECAQKCIKGGSPAVLVMPDGKIYKIANQEKITSLAGKNVTVNGSLKGDTLTVNTVK
jgi:(2Fe-2S) ferredoxin